MKSFKQHLIETAKTATNISGIWAQQPNFTTHQGFVDRPRTRGIANTMSGLYSGIGGQPFFDVNPKAAEMFMAWIEGGMIGEAPWPPVLLPCDSCNADETDWSHPTTWHAAINWFMSGDIGNGQTPFNAWWEAAGQPEIPWDFEFGMIQAAVGNIYYLNLYANGSWAPWGEGDGCQNTGGCEGLAFFKDIFAGN